MSRPTDLLHDRIQAFEDAGQSRNALRFLFTTIDNWLRFRSFDLVEETLRTVRLDKISITVALGFAAITLVVAEELGEARVEYVTRLTAWLQTKEPLRAEELIQGLK